VGRGCSSTQLANTFCARRDVAFRFSVFARFLLVADERDEKPPTRLIKPLSSFCLSPDIRSRRTRRATRSST
jgi:hypothetical protein